MVEVVTGPSNPPSAQPTWWDQTMVSLHLESPAPEPRTFWKRVSIHLSCGLSFPSKVALFTTALIMTVCLVVISLYGIQQFKKRKRNVDNFGKKLTAIQRDYLIVPSTAIGSCWRKPHLMEKVIQARGLCHRYFQLVKSKITSAVKNIFLRNIITRAETKDTNWDTRKKHSHKTTSPSNHLSPNTFDARSVAVNCMLPSNNTANKEVMTFEQHTTPPKVLQQCHLNPRCVMPPKSSSTHKLGKHTCACSKVITNPCVKSPLKDLLDSFKKVKRLLKKEAKDTSSRSPKSNHPVLTRINFRSNNTAHLPTPIVMQAVGSFQTIGPRVKSLKSMNSSSYPPKSTVFKNPERYLPRSPDQKWQTKFVPEASAKCQLNSPVGRSPVKCDPELSAAKLNTKIFPTKSQNSPQSFRYPGNKLLKCSDKLTSESFDENSARISPKDARCQAELRVQNRNCSQEKLLNSKRVNNSMALVNNACKTGRKSVSRKPYNRPGKAQCDNIAKSTASSFATKKQLSPVTSFRSPYAMVNNAETKHFLKDVDSVKISEKREFAEVRTKFKEAVTSLAQQNVHVPIEPKGTGVSIYSVPLGAKLTTLQIDEKRPVVDSTKMGKEQLDDLVKKLSDSLDVANPHSGLTSKLLSENGSKCSTLPRIKEANRGKKDAHEYTFQIPPTQKFCSSGESAEAPQCVGLMAGIRSLSASADGELEQTSLLSRVQLEEPSVYKTGQTLLQEGLASRRSPVGITRHQTVVVNSASVSASSSISEIEETKSGKPGPEFAYLSEYIRLTESSNNRAGRDEALDEKIAAMHARLEISRSQPAEPSKCSNETECPQEPVSESQVNTINESLTLVPEIQPARNTSPSWPSSSFLVTTSTVLSEDYKPHSVTSDPSVDLSLFSFEENEKLIEEHFADTGEEYTWDEFNSDLTTGGVGLRFPSRNHNNVTAASSSSRFPAS